MNIQGWLPLGWTGWISLQSKGLSRVFSKPQFKSINSLMLSLLYGRTLTSIHDCGKTIPLIIQTFVSKVISLLFNMLSRFAIAFPPRSNHLLISWLQSPFSVISKPKKIKSVTVFIVFPSICHEVMGPDVMIFVSWRLSFKPGFSLSSFTFIKRLFSSSSLSAIRVVPSANIRLLIFLMPILILASSRLHPAWDFTWCTLHRSLSRVTLYSLSVLSQFWISVLFHVQF